MTLTVAAEGESGACSLCPVTNVFHSKLDWAEILLCFVHAS
jgi:hypothetical protein